MADGAPNMAADEMLLKAAGEGVASLRFYGWSEATVSLGYFQPASVRCANSRLAALPWVRRPTGGAMLVHHHELTYAIALPSGSAWDPRGPCMARMHAITLRALEGLGLRGMVAAGRAESHGFGKALCFQQVTAGDLLCEGTK